jgi:hypothetical protein
VQTAIATAESNYFTSVAALEKVVVPLLATDSAKAETMLTDFSNNAGTKIISQWEELWKELFFTYRDFFTVSRPTRTGKNHPWPSTLQQGFSKQWADHVVKGTGDQFLVPAADDDLELRKFQIVGM